MEKKVILLIEDNPDDIELTLRVLKKSKILNEVVVAHDGEEALEYLLGKKSIVPAVVLLDLNLPGTDGRDVLERIKADPDLRKIPVVILTTSASPSDIQLCYREGASSYIIKPIRFDDFLKKVRTLKEYWFETVALPTHSG